MQFMFEWVLRELQGLNLKLDASMPGQHYLQKWDNEVKQMTAAVIAATNQIPHPEEVKKDAS